MSAPGMEGVPPAEEPTLDPAQESQPESEITPGEQLILEGKQATLADLQKELHELKADTRKYERHIQLDRDTPADARHKDLDELM